MRPATGRNWGCTAACRRTCRRFGDISIMSAAYLLPAEQGVSMSQFFQIHPDNPQPRLIKQAVEIIRKVGVVVYTPDSSYPVGCSRGNQAGIERIRRLRQLEANQQL